MKTNAKNMEFVRRSVMLKLYIEPRLKKELDDFFNMYGDAVIYTLEYIKRIYFSYEKIPLDKQGICQVCGEKDITLNWRHKTLKKDICNRCFTKLWSMMTLTKADGFQAQLIQAFPDLSPAHKGYYAGVIKMTVPIFKSYIRKLDDRKREITQLEMQLQGETNLIRQKKLRSILKRKKEGIKELQFRKNVIYLGNAGMFEFSRKYNKYYIHITDWQERRHKRTYEVRIGREESYTATTGHNKYKFLNDCIDNKEHKVLFGKLLKTGDSYQFMYPKRDVTHSLSTRKGIQEWYKRNKNANIITLVCGIKNPIRIIVQRKNKVIDIKTFGDGSFWQMINRNRAHRAKVMKDLARKHKSKWKRKKARKRFFRKQYGIEGKKIKHYTQVLTTQLMTYLKEKYGEGIIIMRVTKGIKRINYPPLYRIVLNRWNVEMQKTILEYKEKLRDFHIFMVPYKESNNLKCSKCAAEIKEDKRSVKILTRKLLGGMDKRAILQSKINMTQKKLIKLTTYPQTTERLRFIQETGNELKRLKEQYTTMNGQNHNIFTCQKCGYQNDFLTNDAFALSHSLLSSDA